MTATLGFVAAAAIATRVQVLPDVIDLSLIPTAAGFGSFVSVTVGAAMRFEPERIGRLSLFGTVLGGFLTALALLIRLVIDVLS